MPGFVKTPKDERKWAAAKKAAAKQTSEGSDSYYALANYIFHKSEGNQELAEMYKSNLLKFGGMMQLGLSERATSVKSTKSKKMPGAFDKPSKFFKTEELCAPIKHPSLQKLRDFVMKKHKA